jgi:hypothetical protein
MRSRFSGLETAHAALEALLGLAQLAVSEPRPGAGARGPAM